MPFDFFNIPCFFMVILLISFYFLFFWFGRSPDAKYLALSSQDGYCTLVEFDRDDLGSPFTISGLVVFLILFVSCTKTQY